MVALKCRANKGSRSARCEWLLKTLQSARQALLCYGVSLNVAQDALGVVAEEDLLEGICAAIRDG